VLDQPPDDQRLVVFEAHRGERVASRDLRHAVANARQAVHDRVQRDRDDVPFAKGGLGDDKDYYVDQLGISSLEVLGKKSQPYCRMGRNRYETLTRRE
jgi:hypothetical protein